MNPNNFTHAKLCWNERDFRKAINSRRFLRASVINKDVVIVEYKPEKILYDSPFPIGTTILDLAKLHLYHYYYDILKPTFLPDKVSLLMTDTDSLIFSVNCKNFFDKYKKLPLFDFSNFPKDHAMYSEKKIEKTSVFQRRKSDWFY